MIKITRLSIVKRNGTETGLFLTCTVCYSYTIAASGLRVLYERLVNHGPCYSMTDYFCCQQRRWVGSFSEIGFKVY